MNSDSFRGKQPKTAEQIRAALRSSQLGTPAQASGVGLEDGDRMILTVLRDPRNAKRLQASLRQAGVPSEVRTAKGMTEVVVDVGDRHRAAPVLDQHRQRGPDHVPRDANRRHDWLILSSAVFLTLAITLMAGARTADAVAASLSMMVVGALLGHLIDRLRMQRRTTGRVVLGLTEFLLICALAPLVAFVLAAVAKVASSF